MSSVKYASIFIFYYKSMLIIYYSKSDIFSKSWPNDLTWLNN